MTLNTPAWQIIFASLNADFDITRASKLVATGLNHEELLALCNNHGLLLIVNRALRGHLQRLFDSQFLETWQRDVARTTLQTMTLERELKRLLALFAAAEIPVVPFKGPTLSKRLYGDPLLRVSSDLDLLIEPSYLPKAVQLMCSEGYRASFSEQQLLRWLQPRSPKHHCTLIYDSAGWPVELHWDLFDNWRHAAAPGALIEEWQSPEKENLQETLIYLCRHGCHHWWLSLKWVVDVDRCVRSATNQNWQSLLVTARQRGCLRAVLLGLQLAHSCCGLKLPDMAKLAIKNDPAVARLVYDISQLWQRIPQQEPSLAWKLRYLLACRERFRDKLGMIRDYPLERFYLSKAGSDRGRGAGSF